MGGYWLTSEKGNVLTIKSIILTLVALALLAVPISNAKTAIAEDSYKTNDLHEAYIEYLQAQEWSAQLTAYSKTLVGKRTGWCVIALRERFSVPKSQVQGAAKSTKPNTQTPEIGSVIILKMSAYGHVGIVIKVDGDSVTYFDSNGDWTFRGAIRTINVADKRISGYRVLN